ncbi:hypothetical protein HQ571_02225 [Candidatus Kuenenbacteria bacterium]|nr:hypothetical protein [Candidatus Kuenenbacteria bacterium]
MKINFKKLRDLSVETESGLLLGNIDDFELDIENHSVMKYLVVRRKLLTKGQVLLVSPSQIVSITAEKIIVNDNVEAEQIKQSIKKPFEVKQTVTTNAEIREN